MAGTFQWAPYREALLFLITAGFVVPLFRRMNVSPVLGFLFAGVVLGPAGLGKLAGDYPALAYVAISDLDRVSLVAEFGLVFLLFMIGLELSWERLARMRRLVFGLGLAQIALSTLVFAAAGFFGLDLSPASAGLIGAALSMSSTAIAIPVLAESRHLAHPSGRAAFAILLMQDLMVAPLLTLETLLANAKAGVSGVSVFWEFLPALGSLGVFILAGRHLLRPLFRMVASAHSTELFMAACLLVVAGSGIISGGAGFSMGLGAFLAGLLLAETEYRREIEVTIEPFQGLLLGLFFVSIGAGLDIAVVMRHPGPILIGAALLLSAKGGVIYALARRYRLAPRHAAEAALLLASGGEFAFVLLTGGISSGVLPRETSEQAMIVVTLSMFAVPFLGRFGARLADAQAEAAQGPDPKEFAPQANAAENRVVVIGYGRVGQLVGAMLKRHDIPYIAVENSVTLVTKHRDAGVDIYWGDAARRDFLLACGVAQARAIVVTIENPRKAEEIVRLAHGERADMPIVARARDATHATRLYELGATDAVPETIEASLQLAETVLVDVGVPMGFVIASVHEKRDEYRQILRPEGESARQRQAYRAASKRRVLARRRISGGAAGEPGTSEPDPGES